MNQQNLSQGQQRTYAAYLDYWRQNGRYPTHDEMSDLLQMWKSQVAANLKILAKKGWLEAEPARRHKRFRVVGLSDAIADGSDMNDWVSRQIEKSSGSVCD